MPTSGAESSANTQPARETRKELTPAERASILSARKAGVSRKALAAQFQCSLATITNTCKRVEESGTAETKPRSGRPPKLTAAEIRYMVLMVKRNPRMTWAALLGQEHPEEGSGPACPSSQTHGLNPNPPPRVANQPCMRNFQLGSSFQASKLPSSPPKLPALPSTSTFKPGQGRIDGALSRAMV